MSNLKDNFLLVFKNWKYVLVFLFSTGLFYFLMELFNDRGLMRGNYGEVYFMIYSGSQVILSVLIGLFLVFFLFKFFYFSSFSFKDSSVLGVSSFLGLLAVGCPTCSITFASMLGLVGFLALLPYGGLELKVGLIPIMVYSVYAQLRDLTKCSVSFNKNK